MKTVKISVEGTKHKFALKKVNRDKTEILKCELCGIEGLHDKMNTYVEVKPLKSNKAFIDNCKEPETSGIKELIKKGEEIINQELEKTMHLECKFTEKELNEMGKDLSECYYKLEKIENEKKQANEEFKAQAAEQESDIARLSHCIHDGFENKLVDVVEKLNVPRNHEKTIVRLDTKEIVGIVPMEDSDYSLFPDAEKPEEKKQTKKS